MIILTKLFCRLKCFERACKSWLEYLSSLTLEFLTLLYQLIWKFQHVITYRFIFNCDFFVYCRLYSILVLFFCVVFTIILRFNNISKEVQFVVTIILVTKITSKWHWTHKWYQQVLIFAARCNVSTIFFSFSHADSRIQKELHKGFEEFRKRILEVKRSLLKF